MVWDLEYQWADKRGWRTVVRSGIRCTRRFRFTKCIWVRGAGAGREGDRPLTYREIAPRLAEYVKRMGFTHVELLPIMEHPFYGSWGYQTTGYFAPTSRYGTPQDFMYLVDYLHQQGIGVILDWVPSHFPTDAHGLAYFDGTHLFEHADPRKGFHPDWKTFIFNYGRNEVRSFLMASGLFWLDKYHIDGLRVDAVASMLYLDYSRKAGEWIPNKYGGRENLEASIFCAGSTQKRTKSTRASRPSRRNPRHGRWCRGRHTWAGLGFGMKWDMGWMHDTLDYFRRIPIHRKLSSQPTDIPHAVRLHREFRACRCRTMKSCTAKVR